MFYKTVPMLRLVLPLMAGIVAQYYLQFSWLFACIVLSVALVIAWLFYFLPFNKKFLLSWLNGVAVYLAFAGTGMLVCFLQNIENNKHWIGNHLQEAKVVSVTLQEPLVEKAKSYKALATVQQYFNGNAWKPATGKVLLYLKKDGAIPNIGYGSQIVMNKPLQNIINAGNPGGFNYRRFCLFQQIGEQVFLSKNDYKILPQKNAYWFGSFMMTARLKILSIIRKHITTPNEKSIAEALLIGYRDDLDRDLVQAYSNTGVVHIIAISGLHIAMIYGLIAWLFKIFGNSKKIKITKAIVVIIVLWMFTFIAGNAPSILRSAVMFTFIVTGEVIARKTNIYNNLASSAFLILLLNPFSLWDVGFQLSYSAVLSIVLFSKHIRHWFYLQNKLLQKLWNLSSVTLSAQILTLPLILFHFHQFPTLFLISNLIAVPLSGLILYAEIFLLLVSPLNFLAVYVGKITTLLINWLNNFIQYINQNPFAQITFIQINIWQTIFLYGFIAGIAYWLLNKYNKAFLFAALNLFLFFLIRSYDFAGKNIQQKLVVYNVPQHEAMDVMEGRNYKFIGDSLLLEDAFLRNFHLQPSRVLHRIQPAQNLQNISPTSVCISSANKNIIIINQNLSSFIPKQKIKVDAIIITHNPKIYIKQLVAVFSCKQIIFDASNSMWKINQWEKDCDLLHLQHYSIPEQGAFEIKL